MQDWASAREAFEAAAQWFADTVPTERTSWDGPALGEWTVRDLVGHTSRALLTVESYLKPAPQPVQVGSAVDYFALALASVGDPEAVAERGREAGRALGDDLVLSVRSLVDRVIANVAHENPDAVVATPVGGMSLPEYLTTRTFELTVHTCDLATALGLPAEPPEPAAAQSLALVGALAVRSGHAAELLLATTGRRGLPSGFSVL